MPRNVNPKNIMTGPGQTVPDQGSSTFLSGGAVEGGSGTGGDAGMVLAALRAHILDPKGAHSASAIDMVPIPPFSSDSVEGTLQEVAGGIPWEPPKLGRMSRYVDFHSVPDWGAAKLNDTPIFLRDTDFSNITNTNAYGDVFPYFLQPPAPTLDWGIMNYDVNETSVQHYSPGFLPTVPAVTPAYDDKIINQKNDLRLYGTEFPDGADIFADRVFNYPDLLGADNPGTSKSGGYGRCYAGGFTRTDGAVEKSLRLMAFDDTGGDLWPILTTVSGAIYPADRGVLALVHFPHLDAPTSSDPWSDEMKTAFLNQDLLDRCIAAVLLGQGILGDACIGAVDPVSSIGDPMPAVCDGGPGGIFGMGMRADGTYDPFAYPGRASGQYDLDELHTGVSSLPPGAALPDPWDNLTGQGAGAGAKRAHYTAVGDDYYPAAGQVRLGSDADAGEAIQPWGIPILGATENAYIGVLSTYADYPAISYVGHSIAHSTNFLKYRLPVLDDYSQTSGMKFTPQSRLSAATGETQRYLDATTVNMPSQAPYDYGTAVATTLDVAGNYPPFPQDCITWQIARYRHTFAMDGGNAAYPGDYSPLGSYAMIHFKTEKDFEAMVRDGILPTEVYGIQFLSDHDDVVNDYTAVGTDPEFHGPAPSYGYSAGFYNGLRNEIFLGGPITDHEVARGDCTGTFDWAVPAPGANLGLMQVSGVTYFTPLSSAGVSSFQLESVDVSVDNAWVGGYRTDDAPMATPPATPPALENSPNPAILNLRTFGSDWTTALPASYPAAWYRRDYIVEFPFSELGAFSWAAGPTALDTLDVAITATVSLPGDDIPSFSVDAKPWFYLRRPLTHGGTWEQVIQPEWDSVNGHGFPLTDSGSETVMFHSTSFYTDDPDAGPTHGSSYGNFTKATPVIWGGINHYEAFDSLMNATKDTEERFLDEIYRYQSAISPVGSTWLRTILAALQGPGIGSWAGGPIPVPVQAGKYHYLIDFPAPFSAIAEIEAINNVSWTQLLKHTVDMSNAINHVEEELQVAGLPPRNPPVLDWATTPFPEAGLLRYPVTAYDAAGIRPNIGDDGVTQPDYSAAYGTDLKNYERLFDVAFSRSSAVGTTPPWDAAGQPFVTLRLDGITLSDIQYVTPGPGTTGSASAPKIAVMVKVPGLTTWMDAGRPDGSGPSKQDLVMDGAGCLVTGPYTYDGIDSETGMVYCQIHLNVGPKANLATGILNGVGIYEVPLGIKVVMNAMAAGEYDLVGTGPGTKASLVRGITGIRVVHPNERIANPSV